MRRRRRNAIEPDAIDLLEEAAHLLRQLPARACAAYLVGTVPFVVGVLFFVAEMGRGAFAERLLPGSAFGLGVLYVWMKSWQAAAAEEALAMVEHRPPHRPGVAGWFAIVAEQLRVHTLGLVLLVPTLLVALPLGWVIAYFQGAVVLGVSRSGALHGACLEHARVWPRQNHFILALAMLMALVVFVNVAAAIYAVPLLLRMLLGVDTMFATTGWNELNTTFLAAACGVTFLIVDPFVKSVYVLRCFRSASMRTGADLLVQVRAGAARMGGAVVLMLALGLAIAPASVRGADAASAPVVDVLTPAEIDTAVERVLERPEFAWRLPRVPAPEGQERGAIAAFFESIADWAGRMVRSIGKLIGKIIDFFTRSDASLDPGSEGGTSLGALVGVLRALLPVLGVALVLAIAWFGWRWWRRSRIAVDPMAHPIVMPALEREDLTADALPEDEWMQLARQLLARGDVRLALRALFLGTLAALAAKGVIVLARHKSNRDYEREIARRGGASGGGLAVPFAENRSAFERVWYGEHPVAPEAVQRFEENVRRLRGGDA